MDIPRGLRWVLVARGALAVLLGVLAICWPSITVGVVVLLFAVYAFVAAGVDLVLAIHVHGAGPTFGYLALATLSVMAGFAALLWPGATAVLVSWCVAFWALATGIVEIALATRHGITPGRRAMWVAGGSVSVAVGLVLALDPGIGPLALGIVFGLFSMVYGITVVAGVARPGGARRAVGAGSAR